MSVVRGDMALAEGTGWDVGSLGVHDLKLLDTVLYVARGQAR